MGRSLVLLLVLLFAVPVWAGSPDPINPTPGAGATFFSTLDTFLKNEDADRYAEMFRTFVVSGGTHGTTSGTLTATPTALIAYAGGYRVTESGSITYPASSTCYTIFTKTTDETASGYTRIAGTHYMRDCAGSQNTLPSAAGNLMTVVTSGTEVTSVTDTRIRTPVPATFINASAPPWNLSTANTAAQNDTVMSAILAAITGTSATVYIPAGTYNIGGASGLVSIIKVPAATKVEFVGDGKGRTVLQTDYATVGAVDFISSKTASDCTTCTDRISVRSLTLKMTNAVRNTGSAAIRITNSLQVVENVEINGWHSNGVVCNGDNSETVNVADCVIAHNDFIDVLEYGARVINTSHARIVHNRFKTVGNSGAIVLQGKAHDAVIEGNVFDTGRGIALEESSSNSPEHVKIVHNTMRAGTFCIYTSTPTTAAYQFLTIIGNSCTGQTSAATPAIDLVAVRRSKILANDVHNGAFVGIRCLGIAGVTDCTNNTFAGNVVRNSANDNYRFDRSLANVITANESFDSAGGYGYSKINSTGTDLLGLNQASGNSSGAFNGSGFAFTLDTKLTSYNATAPADGQVLIGGTAAGNWTAATISGTSNQITSTPGNNTITLSTPQNIHTAATPQFAGLGLGAAAGATGSVTLVTTLFAALGTPSNGTLVYCSDCAAASNPCTGSSTGTFAIRIAGAWKCL